jgi:hypothetical protein
MAHSKHRRELARATTVAGGAVDIVDNSIRIDWTRLDPPTNVYDADFAWAAVRHGTVSLFFAKEFLSANRLRSRMELRFGFEAFVGAFWESSADFFAKLKAKVTPPPEVTRSAADLMALESEREHSDWASFAYMAHHGTQASLDFFRLPPAGIARFITGGGTSGLKPDPIVRVHTTVWELYRLLEMCEPIVSQVRGLIPTEKGQPSE